MTEMHALTQMLCELESAKLEVCLAPSRRRDRRDHDMIRVAICRPPVWYSRFCCRHLSDRKRMNNAPDTKIKRENVLTTLRVLTTKGASVSKYADELRKIAATIK